MGVVVYLVAPPRRAALPHAVSTHDDSRTSPTITHLERAIERYERDLGLMEGKLVPMSWDLDDWVILEHLRTSADPDGLISDRKIRIKTLQATVDLLREDPEDTGSAARG